MPKRRPAFDPCQLGLFEAAPPAVEGTLADLERRVSSAVTQILKTDPRSRYEVAGGMSALLNDDVSKQMLDAYSAELKDTHNISFARMLALIAETQRFDVLDQLCQEIGCKLVIGEEVFTFELGHIQAQIEQLQQRQRTLKQVAGPVTRGGRRK